LKLPADAEFTFVEESNTVIISTSDTKFDASTAFQATDTVQFTMADSQKLEVNIDQVNVIISASSLDGIYRFDGNLNFQAVDKTLDPLVYTGGTLTYDPGWLDGTNAVRCTRSLSQASAASVADFPNRNKRASLSFCLGVKIGAVVPSATWTLVGTRNGSSPTNAYCFYLRWTNNNTLALGIGDSANQQNVQTTTVTWTANRYYFICGNFDYFGGKIDLWVHSSNALQTSPVTGNFDFSTFVEDSNRSDSNLRLNGAADNSTAENYIAAQYDFLAFFNTPLNTEDTIALYRGHTLGWYKLEDNSTSYTNEFSRMSDTSTSLNISDNSAFTLTGATSYIRSGTDSLNILNDANANLNFTQLINSNFVQGFTCEFAVKTPTTYPTTGNYALIYGTDNDFCIFYDADNNRFSGALTDPNTLQQVNNPLVVPTDTEIRLQFRVNYIAGTLELNIWNPSAPIVETASGNFALIDCSFNAMTIFGSQTDQGITLLPHTAGAESFGMSDLRFYSFAKPDSVDTYTDVNTVFDNKDYIDSIVEGGGNTNALVISTQSPYSNTSSNFTRFRDQTNATFALTGATVNVPGSSGTAARELKQFQFILKPPLGIFRSKKYIPGGTRFSLRLTPSTNYRLRAVQSSGTSKVPRENGNENDYDFKVLGQQLLVSLIRGPEMQDGSFLMDYASYNMQPKLLKNVLNQQGTFTVPQSTYQLAVANAASTVSTLYPPSVFIAPDNKQKSITSLNVEYSNLKYPNSGVIDASFNEITGVDKRTRVYADTYLTMQNEDPEKFEYWSDDYGQYVAFSVMKNPTDFSSIVTVNQSLENTPADDMRMLLFSVNSRVALVKYQNGRVVDVQVTDA